MLRVPLSERGGDARWGMVRLVLGFAQMFGATTGVVLLLGTGLSIQTIAVVVVTSVCTIVSRILFRDR